MHATVPSILPLGADIQPAFSKQQTQETITAAVASYRLALNLTPDDAQAYDGLAQSLQSLQQLTEAETAYRRAIELDPSSAPTLCRYGDLLREMKCDDQAIVIYQAALLLAPDNATACNNLGMALQATGKMDEAIAAYQQMLALTPGSALAYNNIGSVQQTQGLIEPAMQNYLRALDIEPRFAPFHFNLGNSLLILERFEEALKSFSNAIEFDPKSHMAHNNLISVLSKLGRIDEEINRCRLALRINPEWETLHSDLLFSLSHSPQVDAAALRAEHQRFAEQFEAPLRANLPQHGNERDPERRLRIGFVSADLYNHAVANFITPVLENLLHAPGLELLAYSNSKHNDQVTEHLRGLVNVWHQVEHLSHEELAQQISDDGIDILIDLSGHTGNNRLLTFARKPAPLQASWIGYPGTTGLQAMDYYLTDRNMAPPGLLDEQFTEKLVFLPASAPFIPSPDAPPVSPAPACEHGYITFGSFNRPAKLSRGVIARWSKLLLAVPNARMVLGGMPSEDIGNKLRDWFNREGIASERLSFYAHTNTSDYLALHRLVDVCLDTFPYTGGTTTLHALWMGVPTLTMMGSNLPGRVGATLLEHVGLDTFIAEDEADFLQKGMLIAKDMAQLATLRTGLRARVKNSAMGQPALIAAGLENALRTMWQRWCAGLAPISFEADPAQSSLSQRATSMKALHEVNLEAALPLAIEHHQAGRFVEAETLYLAIIHRQADHAIANHNMGLLAGQLGFHDDALPYFRTALSAAPHESQFYLSYVNSLLLAGQAEHGLEIIERAIASGLDNAELQAMLQRVHAAIIAAGMPTQGETQQPATASPDDDQAEDHLETLQQDRTPPLVSTDGATFADDRHASTATTNFDKLPKVNISTEDDFVGLAETHPLAKQFLVLEYEDGALTTIPHRFFRDWLDEEAQSGSFYIGRCSGFGVGSLVKYDSDVQSLCVGRYVAGGLRLRFLLNDQLETRTISSYMLCAQGMGLRSAPSPQYADSVIKNDVWIGDEVMMLGGGIIENGCVIGARSVLPPNFRSEPYGVYVGSPARLIRYRFSERVRAALLDLAWWEMPLSWVRDNNEFFLQDMTAEDHDILPMIEMLRASRDKFLAGAMPGACSETGALAGLG